MRGVRDHRPTSGRDKPKPTPARNRIARQSASVRVETTSEHQSTRLSDAWQAQQTERVETGAANHRRSRRTRGSSHAEPGMYLAPEHHVLAMVATTSGNQS